MIDPDLQSKANAAGLPCSLRYVKNGAGGQWWPAAQLNGQLHAGWNEVPAAILAAGDYEAAEPYVLESAKHRGAGARDASALRALIDRPSQHIWITFQDRRLWWCTVKDEVHASPNPSTKDRGHFWLTCDKPWRDRTADGVRQLHITDLPGTVTKVAGFRGTVCKPEHAEDILRAILNIPIPEVIAAKTAREAYEDAIAELIGKLHDKDFELLVDLILARDGWIRRGPIGGSMADIDMEVENQSANEIAYVQVKSESNQSTLDECISRFRRQQDHYARMIFAVHNPMGALTATGPGVHLWTRQKLASLTVRLGLGPWLESRLRATAA